MSSRTDYEQTEHCIHPSLSQLKHVINHINLQQTNRTNLSQQMYILFVQKEKMMSQSGYSNRTVLQTQQKSGI